MTEGPLGPALRSTTKLVGDISFGSEPKQADCYPVVLNMPMQAVREAACEICLVMAGPEQTSGLLNAFKRYEDTVNYPLSRFLAT